MYLDKTKIERVMAIKGLGVMEVVQNAQISYKGFIRTFSNNCRPATAGKIAAALGVKVEEIEKIEKDTVQ